MGEVAVRAPHTTAGWLVATSVLTGCSGSTAAQFSSPTALCVQPLTLSGGMLTKYISLYMY